MKTGYKDCLADACPMILVVQWIGNRSIGSYLINPILNKNWFVKFCNSLLISSLSLFQKCIKSVF